MKMNWSGTWLLAVMFANGIITAHAQLLLLPEPPQVVFAGNERTVNLRWHNTGAKTAEVDVRTRIYQTSSATAVPVSDTAWKTLRVLPQQTVLESASLDFPEVKAETEFLVQWLDNSNHVLGRTEVLVYSTNLLAELKPLLEGETLGVLDPNNELKPLLRQNEVRFVDLGQATLEDFSGRLAILGPFKSKAQLPEDAVKRTQAMAKNGVAVVWLQPPTDPRDPLRPSYYSVTSGTNAIVVVQSGVVAGLAESPQAQQRLVQLCRLALHPEPVALPETNHQP
jgi:hypothetical protein